MCVVVGFLFEFGATKAERCSASFNNEGDHRNPCKRRSSFEKNSSLLLLARLKFKSYSNLQF